MLSMQITGLEDLQRQLQEAQEGFEALNGDFATLRFDPADPESVSRGIREMEAAVDAKAASYAGNPFVSEVADAMKRTFRERIQNAVAEAV